MKEFKKRVENKSIDDSLYIFVSPESNFIPIQYINQMAKDKGREVEVVDDISDIKSTNNLFSNLQKNTIKIVFIDTFDVLDDSIFLIENSYIICSKISKASKDKFANRVVEVPKLEEWQIKDYAYSTCSGISKQSLDKLIEICKNDIYRIDNELSKLRVFHENERQALLDKFIKDDMFDDLSTYTVFNFTNALLNKDIKKVIEIAKELYKIEVDPFGMVTLLLNNLRQKIKIFMSKNATPESTHINAKVFWAIKYAGCKFTPTQLIRLFEKLSNIDYLVKTSQLTVSNELIDLIIIYTFS